LGRIRESSRQVGAGWGVFAVWLGVTGVSGGWGEPTVGVNSELTVS